MPMTVHGTVASFYAPIAMSDTIRRRYYHLMTMSGVPLKTPIAIKAKSKRVHTPSIFFN